MSRLGHREICGSTFQDFFCLHLFLLFSIVGNSLFFFYGFVFNTLQYFILSNLEFCFFLLNFVKIVQTIVMYLL